MLAMFSQLWSMLARFISAADKVAMIAEDLAETGRVHSESLRLKTQAELSSELRQLEKQLAAIEAQ